MPLVSIGLPVADEPISLVSRAIQSIFSQSTDDWELIIVADAAPPTTVEFLQKIDDSRVRIHAYETRAGLAARLNEIPHIARGTYLARMDSDDVMLPDRLRRQVSILESDSSIDLVTSRAIVIDQNARIIGKTRRVPDTLSKDELLRRNPFVHPTAIAKTSWWRSHRYDTALARGQDYAFWIESYDSSVYYWDDEPALFYQVSAELSPQKYARSKRSSRQVIRKHGPTLVGWAGTLRLLGVSITKEYLVWLASKTNGSERILSQRFEELNEHERNTYERLMSLHPKTTLPLRSPQRHSSEPPSGNDRTQTSRGQS